VAPVTNALKIDFQKKQRVALLFLFERHVTAG
jgi:hypothetical protein